MSKSDELRNWSREEAEKRRREEWIRKMQSQKFLDLLRSLSEKQQKERTAS